MADKIFHSTAVTFVDMTDSRSLDVYISSNHPTVQLYDSNKTTSKYTPDWSVANLELEASFYLDSQSITPTSIKWYIKIGTTKNELTSFQNKNTLLVTTNSLSSNPIITYICEATYDTLSAFKEITFARVDAGTNGNDGSSAPAVVAQYSVDGSTWTTTLNATTHKYIRYSYDGGKTYTTAIKMVGEDGTSVRIVGTATSVTQVSGTSYYTLVYSSSAVTSAVLGDAYLYSGDLYVCADSRDGQDYFINVGKIQGPTGNDGQSSYLFIRYATDASGTGMSTSPSGKTYMGVYTSNTNVAPTTASSYTWSKFVGDSAKSIVLNGDSQVFKVSTSNTYTPSTIKVAAQAFNTSATTWTYSTNGGQSFVSAAPTGVSRNGNIVTITGASLASDSLVVKASDGSVEDVFTVYKAFDGLNGNPGTPGESASMAFLTNENVTFAADANGNIATTSIETRVVAYNGSQKVTPELLKNTDGSYAISNLPTGMSYIVGDVSNNEIPIIFTITNNATSGYISKDNGDIAIKVAIPNGDKKSTTDLSLTWSRVKSGPQGPQGNAGVNAYTVLLTNESHTFAGDVSNAIAGSTTTKILAYEGATKKSVTDISVNGKTASLNYVDTGITGLQFKCSAVSGEDVEIEFKCTTSFVSKNGTIPIKFKVNSIEFAKMFTYAIALKGNTGGTGAQGPQGTAATSYWLVSSASAVQKTSTGTITVTPSTLTFTGKSKTGTNAPVDYACRWIIDYSTDGTTYTNLYTSTANEASKSITVATTYKTIRARMYMAGGTTALLDEQIIPVVVDGTSASIVDITPSAYYFKSTTGKDGTFTPEYIYLYPRFQTVTYSAWQYSVDGGATWVSASGANGLTISTYSSVANTLRIARTSTLYTDTVTSISFRCVSSNTSVYDTVSIAKIYDVVDLQIGGRNYIKNSAPEITKEAGVAQAEYLSLPYDLTPLIEEHGVDQTYTLSFDLKSKNITNNNRISVYPEPGTTPPHKYAFPNTTFVVTQEYQRFSITFKPTRSSNANATLTRISVYGTYDTGNIPVIKNLKLELGNKATDWSPAPEDLNNITFQIYAPNGYLLTNDLQSLTLQTFAYEGSLEIVSGATFQWSHLIDDVWTNISGATGTALTVTKSDVLKAKSYRCIMTYKSKTYTSTITVQDKTDTYNSIMCISSNTKGSECYWVLYTLVYSDTSEIDTLLGPISISAPASPVNGDYWYAVDSTNAMVQLKKYNGTTWVNSTDKQSLTYLWNIVNDGSVKTPIGGASKVQVVSCRDFTATATLMCDVSNESDGILTQSSLSITDASDPIVSQTEPTNAVDGQIWIKPNTNGAYNMFVWSEAAQTWIASDMDTRNKVYTSKPSSYSKGDIWITESNTVHSQYLEGTLLQALQDNTVYNENDWSSTLKYDKDIAKINSTLYDLSQYVTITSSGLKIGAVNSDKELSPFTSLFTSTELAFYQNSDKLLTLANNQLTAPRIVVEEELEVNKKISLGDLQITIESNGSFSFAVTK